MLRFTTRKASLESQERNSFTMASRISSCKFSGIWDQFRSTFFRAFAIITFSQRWVVFFRREDPGTLFAASTTDTGFGVAVPFESGASTE